jgi:hypothetical protein
MGHNSLTSLNRKICKIWTGAGANDQTCEVSFKLHTAIREVVRTNYENEKH